MKPERNWGMAHGTSSLVAGIAGRDVMAALRIERIRPATRIRAGDIFRCPDHGDVAVIQSGTLVVELMMTCGSALPLARYAVGDVVPTLNHLSSPAFTLSYRAELSTQVLWLRGDLVGPDVLERAAQARDSLQLGAMRQIAWLVCLPAACRLYVEILRHAARTETATFELPTHGELASRACTTRETVSREISTLKREGVLSQDRAARLLAPDDLTRRIARALNLDDDADVWDSIGVATITVS